MDIGFFINYDNQVVQLPVNPDKVTVQLAGNNTTKDIINLGEINLLKDRKLAKISFKSFFPQEDWFPAVRTRGEFKTPDFYKEFIESIVKAKKPCRLVITGIDITMKCSIEDFEYYHQGGDHEDAYYSLELKEYRDYSIIQIPINPLQSNSSSTSSSSSNTSSSNNGSSSGSGSSSNNTPASNSGSSSLTGNTSGSIAPSKPLAPAQITKGCTVILNGTVHRDSYGNRPGKTFKDYVGKVNLINNKGSHPYHVTTPSGGWLGWVTAESVVLG